MKKENSILLNLLSFIFGAFVCYVATQYQYLELNKEVNVVNTLVGISTAIIGLYIAISIQKKYNRNQSLHNYVQSKFDSMWSNFDALNNQLKSRTSIPLAEVTREIKNLFRGVDMLKRIFSSFKIKSECLEQLENKIEELDKLLTDKLPVNDNQIDLNTSKEDIKILTGALNEKFSLTLVQIIKIL